MEKVTIKNLVGKSDEELLELLGYASKVEEFKENLAAADKLEGKAREKVEERIEKMFTPHVYPDEIKWAIEDATRKSKSGKEAMNDCSCASVLD